jgi:hypothetical protein
MRDEIESGDFATTTRRYGGVSYPVVVRVERVLSATVSAGPEFPLCEVSYGHGRRMFRFLSQLKIIPGHKSEMTTTDVRVKRDAQAPAMEETRKTRC